MGRQASRHPAVDYVLGALPEDEVVGTEGGRYAPEETTSLSLARALAIGLLGRLNFDSRALDVWDPAAGGGLAGALLLDALGSVGISARYFGQDISENAAAEAARRLKSHPSASIAQDDTLLVDAFPDVRADLVIVDAPWGVSWAPKESEIAARRSRGAFRFGLPDRSDASWLFVTLALEKLRPANEGGGRVAALLNPGALSSGRKSAEVRRRIVEAGLLESVTRLPEGLAPNTGIALYLLTFSNTTTDRGGKALIGDLRTQFTTERHRRIIPIHALDELERGLRTRKPGPRNRVIPTRQFTRRDAELSRTTAAGERLAWRVSIRRDTPLDESCLTHRYGPDAAVRVVKSEELVDIDPSLFFEDRAVELSKSMTGQGWPTTRLSAVLEHAPEIADPDEEMNADRVFVPTGSGPASTSSPPEDARGRTLALEVDGEVLDPSFLAAWLNSELGSASRQLARDSGGSGVFVRAVRSDPRSLMRWADELIVPTPTLDTQRALATADERLRSFQAELATQRTRVWTEPEGAAEVVGRLERVFDDSLRGWLEDLPYPIASALWTAETVPTAGDKQRAYIHAWEGIVIFHATVLLSACRTDPGLSSEVETSVRRTLEDYGLGIERATFRTWIIIAEKCGRELSRMLQGDRDGEARIRRAFADLGPSGIERLVSRDVVRKFNEVNRKRNRWLGHSGFVSESEHSSQVEELIGDLRELQAALGDVWAQLRLVRAGASRRTRQGYRQEVEIAMGTRSPFASETLSVGDIMVDGELYLVRDGSDSPLALEHFVQLRAAPSSAQFTSYFYNRTEGPSVRMVSYQHGPLAEVDEDATAFRESLGSLASPTALT